jgi:CHAT domain-containing protein/tetratricopeptide (TPR) repeat protein
MAGGAWRRYVWGKSTTLWLAAGLLLPATAAGTPERLRPGETIEIALSSQRPTGVTVEAGPNQVAILIVDQDEPSLRLRVSSHDGRELRVVSSGFAGAFIVAVAPTSEGTFRVDAIAGQLIRAAEAVTISLEAISAQDADVTALLEAGELFLEGQRRRSEPKAKSIQQAIDIFRRARERCREGHSRSGEALAREAEGDARLQLSQYSDAVRAYAAGRELVAANSRLMARLLNAQAALDLELWKRDEARFLAERALAIAREVPDRRAEADALASLAIAKYQFAERNTNAVLQVALEAARTYGNRLAAARVLTVQGWAEKDLGHNGRAIERIEEAARLFQEIGRTVEALSAMVDIASTERLRGDPFSAVLAHGKMLKLFQQAGSSYYEALTRDLIGYDYMALNRPRDALPYIREARRLFAAVGDAWDAQTAAGLACDIELSFRDYPAAEPDCAEARRIAAEFQLPIYVALADSRLGKLAEARGQLAAAEVIYRSSARVSAEAGYSRGEASATMSLGLLAERRGGAAAGLEFFQKALALSEKAEDPAGEIEAKFHIGRVYADTGRLDEAQQAVEEAAVLAEAERGKIRSDKLRSSYFAAVRKCYDLSVEVLMRRHAANPKAGFERQALEKSEAARARTLFDALHIPTSEAGRHIAESADLVRLRTALNERYDARLKLILAGGKQRDLETSAEQIRRLSAEYDQALAVAQAEAKPLEAPRPITAEEMARASADRMILEYHLGDRRSYLWRIERGTITSFQLPARKTIAEAVGKWRELASARQGRPEDSLAAYRARVDAADRELPALAAKLSCLLLAGLRFGKEGRLTIIADGTLQSLPFAALPSDGCHNLSSPPLIATQEIANAPSLRILTGNPTTARRTAGKKEVAILADPVFSAKDSRVKPMAATPAKTDSQTLKMALRDVGFTAELPRLYGTRKEAEAILELAKGSALPALDFQANLKTALSGKLANYRIWHFATHGLADVASPELSGLVFSLVDAKGRPVRGYLKIQDILDLRIDPELVVLSACNSGIGEQSEGEGAAGLAYAFLHAGAKQVVSTIWSVEDAASGELMREFYKGLLRDHLMPAGALRQAQTAMLGKGWTQPFYWAGYVLIAK